ncbi:MAG: O-antigen ligase family protein [Bacteroidota bacterium]
MNFKTLISWSMVASVFMDDFIILRFVLPFDFYVYYLIFIVNIIYYIAVKPKPLLIPKWFSRSIFLIIGVTLVVTQINGTFDFRVVKQIIGIVFTSIAYYTFISLNNFNLKQIFKWYIIAAFLVSGYGIMEEFLHLSGIHISKDVRRTGFGLYRIYSIMGEPYFLAVAIIPALYFLWANIKKRVYNYSLRKQFYGLIIISICFILTFSSAGFIGFALIILFMFYNRGYFSITNWRIIFLPLIFVTLILVFSNIKDGWQEFDIKYTETIGAFTSGTHRKEDVASMNSSSFALYSNYLVAMASFEDYPITGTGLGTHEKNYIDRFSEFFDSDFLTRYGAFNNYDANSLFLRLMSETGLLGLGLFFTFLLKFFLRRKGYRNPELRDYTIMNQGIFIWFVVRLVRTGNYFGNGFFLFFFIYYFSWKIVKNQLRQQGNVKEKRIVTQKMILSE